LMTIKQSSIAFSFAVKSISFFEIASLGYTSSSIFYSVTSVD
jgi:hypothetical protein